MCSNPLPESKKARKLALSIIWGDLKGPVEVRFNGLLRPARRASIQASADRVENRRLPRFAKVLGHPEAGS
jgi:hypothetical protein